MGIMSSSTRPPSLDASLLLSSSISTRISHGRSLSSTSRPRSSHHLYNKFVSTFKHKQESPYAPFNPTMELNSRTRLSASISAPKAYCTEPRSRMHTSRVERQNRTILDAIRTLLSAANSPKKLWVGELTFFLWCRNRFYRSSVLHESPYQSIYGRIPDVSCAVPFSTPVMAFFHEENRSSKLDLRVVKGMVVGIE